MYNYDDLNSFIQKQIGKVDPTKDDSKQLFNLFFDNSVFRAVILLHNSVEVDLSKGTFADLLGFEKKVLDQTTNVSKNVPNITEEWTGFTSIAILSREKFKTWGVTCCCLCQLLRFQSVTPSQRNQGDFHGIL